MDASNFVELNLNVNIRLPRPHPNSLINIPNEISGINELSGKIMALNDTLLNYRRELFIIHQHQHHVGRPIINFNLNEANKRFQESIKNLNQERRTEPDGRLAMNVTMAAETAQNHPPIKHGIFPQNQTDENTQTLNILAENDNEEEELQNRPTMGFGSGNNLPNPASRKRFRKTWTKQLHFQFLQAVKYLGGAQAVTPTLIHQTMDIDGLTIDQVRSHLQVYRRKLKTAAATGQEEEDLESVGEFGDDGTPLHFNEHHEVRKTQLCEYIDDSFSRVTGSCSQLPG